MLKMIVVLDHLNNSLSYPETIEVASRTEIMTQWSTVLGTTVIRRTEFWSDPQNLPVSAEFLHVCGMLRILVLASDKEEDKYGIYCSGWGGRKKLITACRQDCIVAATWALTRKILKISNLPEILPAYLADRLSVNCAYRRQLLHIWSASVGHRKLIAIFGKFAAVRYWIWQTGPRNLEKIAAENCGAYTVQSDMRLQMTHHKTITATGTTTTREWPPDKTINKQLNEVKQAAHHTITSIIDRCKSPHYLRRGLPRQDRVDGRSVTIVRVNVDKNNRPVCAMFAK